MIKLDFVVPGFSKCGTTTLCSMLDQHPSIFIPAIKEPWFFNSPRQEEKRNDYIGLFAEAGDGQLLGEGSVSYSGHENEERASSGILANNPDCRIIFLARNPIKRIESSYREMHHSGILFGIDAPYSLSECLRVFPQMLLDSCYMDRSKPWIERFGEDSVLFLFLEDLLANPEGELERCFAHLGLSETTGTTNVIHLNDGKHKLYDSRLLRRLRTHPLTGPRIARLSPSKQDVLFSKVGLRRRFRHPVEWDRRAISLYRESVQENARLFLEFCGKDQSFWQLDFDSDGQQFPRQ